MRTAVRIPACSERLFLTIPLPIYRPKAGDRVTVFDGKTYGETYGNKGFGLSNVKAAKYKSAGRKWLDWDLPTVDPGNKMYFYYQRAHGVNFRYIRYADVLLMYAEAVVSGGRQGSLTPLEAVNRVRARSGVDMPPLPAVDRAAIENERNTGTHPAKDTVTSTCCAGERSRNASGSWKPPIPISKNTVCRRIWDFRKAATNGYPFRSTRWKAIPILRRTIPAGNPGILPGLVGF